jgi:hypothetical protein
MYSAHIVKTGILAMIIDAVDADVSFIPTVSNKKYIVTPKRALMSKIIKSFVFIFILVSGSSFLNIGKSRTDAIKKRRKAMVNGGTPALRMVLELTKDIPQKITVTVIARFARIFGVVFGLQFKQISFFH